MANTTPPRRSSTWAGDGPSPRAAGRLSVSGGELGGRRRRRRGRLRPIDRVAGLDRGAANLLQPLQDGGELGDADRPLLHPQPPGVVVAVAPPLIVLRPPVRPRDE